MGKHNLYKVLFVVMGLMGVTLGYNACSSEYQIAATDGSIDGNKALGEIVDADNADNGDVTDTGDVVDINDVDTLPEVDDAIENHVCHDGEENDPETVKVRICHIPPGNPEAQHEICVSVHALPALTGGKPTPLQGYLGHCLSIE